MIDMTECVNFLRKNNVLKNWTDTQIVIGINRAIKECALTYTTDKNGKLDGLVFGRWVNDFTVHITAIAGKGKLKEFFAYLKRVFPNCTKIEAVRYGITKIYDI